VEATLLDEQPVINAFERLRRVYPRLLNVRRERDEARQSLTLGAPVMMDRPERLFAEFFKEMTGRDLSPEEEEEVRSAMRAVERNRRELAAPQGKEQSP